MMNLNKYLWKAHVDATASLVDFLALKILSKDSYCFVIAIVDVFFAGLLSINITCIAPSGVASVWPRTGAAAIAKRRTGRRSTKSFASKTLIRGKSEEGLKSGGRQGWKAWGKEYGRLWRWMRTSRWSYRWWSPRSTNYARWWRKGSAQDQELWQVQVKKVHRSNLDMCSRIGQNEQVNHSILSHCNGYIS